MVPHTHSYKITSACLNCSGFIPQQQFRGISDWHRMRLCVQRIYCAWIWWISIQLEHTSDSRSDELQSYIKRCTFLAKDLKFPCSLIEDAMLKKPASKTGGLSTKYASIQCYKAIVRQPPSTPVSALKAPSDTINAHILH